MDKVSPKGVHYLLSGKKGPQVPVLILELPFVVVGPCLPNSRTLIILWLEKASMIAGYRAV